MKSLLALALVVSACAHYPEPATPDTPSGPRITDETAEAGTYKVFTGVSIGTGWAVTEDLLITAGHLCDAGPHEYMLFDKDGVVIVAKPVKWVNADGPGVPRDVCVMRAAGGLVPLPLADRMPAEGTPVEYFGYPRANYAHHEGVYIGDIDGNATQWNDYVATAPCAPGASGSAMYSDAGVYGVLVRLMFTGAEVIDGEFGCVASPLGQIVEILAAVE